MDRPTSRNPRKIRQVATIDLAVSALVAISGVLCVAVQAPQYIRILISVPLLLFVPGYLFVLSLFPRRHEMRLILRIGLSLVCSTALISVLSLLLSLTRIGLSAQTLAVAVGLLTAILIVGATLRRRGVAASGGEIFVPVLYSRWRESVWATTRSTARLYFIVTVLIAAGAVCLGFVVPAPLERFTELIAHDYTPLEAGGANSSLQIEIRNHEGVPTNYTLIAVLVNQTYDPPFNHTRSDVVGLLGRSTLSITDGVSGSVLLSVPPNGTSGANQLGIVLFKTELPSLADTDDQLLHQGFRNLSLQLPEQQGDDRPAMERSNERDSSV